MKFAMEADDKFNNGKYTAYNTPLSALGSDTYQIFYIYFELCRFINHMYHEFQTPSR